MAKPTAEEYERVARHVHRELRNVTCVEDFHMVATVIRPKQSLATFDFDVTDQYTLAARLHKVFPREIRPNEKELFQGTITVHELVLIIATRLVN